MDVDDDPAPPLNYFICEGPETPAQRLAQATPKGYPTLLAYAEAIGNAAMLEHMKKAWNVARLRYHIECKRDLYNKSDKATLTSSRAAQAEKESAQKKRRRTAPTACSSMSSRSVQLLYKNVCILCNQPAHLFPNHPETARKRYRVPDNLTADGMKKKLLKTAQGRKNDWGTEVGLPY